MTNQQIEEINFWKNLYNSLGQEGFLALRKADYLEKTKYFRESLEAETGKGLDVGCGMLSILEFSPLNNVYAIDPLLVEYHEAALKDIIAAKVLNPKGSVTYLEMRDLDAVELTSFKDEEISYILNVNVIDHTPKPQLMVDEMHRILQTGGRLYFEVNQDDDLSPAHYAIWDYNKVCEHFTPDKWNLIQHNTERNPNYGQFLLHFIFEKI